MIPPIKEIPFETDPCSPQDAIPDRLARTHTGYIVEYGIRADDNAFVFHFYPPLSATRWDPVFKMSTRLEKAMPACFDTKRIQADEVLNAARASADDVTPMYCVIVRGLGGSPDPWPLVNRFFEVIEAPL